MPLTRTPIRARADEILGRVKNAARESVNEVVDAARDDAEATHSWKDDPELRTLKSGRRVDTHLERQIVSVHADSDDNPTGSFGTTKRAGFYGLFHELGTVHEFERPFLRPAADRQFPRLAEVIREKLQ